MTRVVVGQRTGPLHDLAHAVGSAPDRPLLVWKGGEMTVSQFADAVRSAAAELLDRGVRPGDRVAIMASNSHRVLVLTYAIWTVRGVEVAVNAELKGPLLRHVLDDSDPMLLFSDEAHAPVAREQRPDLIRVDLDDVRLERSTQEVFELAGEGTVASLLYTSGTSGPSKGVMIPHGYYSYFASVLGSVVGLTPDDTCYFTLPFFHVDAHIALPAALRWGSRLAFVPRFSVSAFWPDVIEFGATWFGAVGSMLSALLTRGRPPEAALARMRLILAAPVPDEAFTFFEDDLGITVLEMYGQTEANGPLYSTLERRRRGAVGWPCAGFDIEVVDSDRRPVATGQVGELLTRPTEPNSRALGYWRRPDATAASFDGNWFRTGDLVCQDEDGFVWYAGRKSDSLRHRGENISAYELESVLTAAPGVRIAAALAVRDELGGEDEIKAVLVVDDTFGIESFVAYCRASLPRFSIPRYVELVDEGRIVRGPGTGSVQKHQLAQGITASTVDINAITGQKIEQEEKTMKVIVVGGTGRVGRRVVSEIAAHPHVAVTASDRVRPDDDAVAFIELDLADHDSLRHALNGFDVVVNTAGPFDRWGAVVLDAAIEAGIDYVDVCDDPLPTLELLERDEAAKAAGIRAVVGLGVSPGLTNFLAVVAAGHLDSIGLLATFWGDSAEGMDSEQAAAHARELATAFATGRAAYTHLITQTSSEVPIWRDGARTTERAWKSAYRVRTTKGETGIYRVIGHPEPVTVPRTITTDDCINIGTVDAGTDRLMLPYLDEVASGNLDAERALEIIAKELKEHPEKLVSTRNGDPLPRNIGAAAVGTRAGERSGVVVFPGGPVNGSMSLETARPAVVGVLHLDEVSPGVHAPETAFDAEAFLGYYSQIYWNGGEAYSVDHAGADAVVEVER